MTPGAQAVASKYLAELRAVMPPGSIVVQKLTESFGALAEQIAALKCGRLATALGSAEEANWRELAQLSARELDVLTVISGAGKRGINREGIYGMVFSHLPDADQPDIINISIQIHRIRQKFKAKGLADPIETIRGRGYRVSTFPSEIHA